MDQGKIAYQWVALYCPQDSTRSPCSSIGNCYTSFYFRLYLLKKGEIQDEWFVQSVAMIDSSSAVLGEGVGGGAPGWFFVCLLALAFLPACVSM